MRLVLDSAVYSLDAVKKAAYRFLDRFATDIRLQTGAIVCDLVFSRNASEAQKEAIVADFRTEVLDQDLRERIARETAAVRNAILAVAFSPTSPQGE
jgi:His-Xaa-Ser system protein HxsD